AFAAGGTVAVNFVSLTIPFYVFMRKQAEDEAKKLNIKLLVEDAESSTPKQASDLENALTQGVDGIVVAPTDVKATAPAINEVLKEGVPLIAVDRRVEGTSKPVPYVAADNVAGGRLMGEWVTKNMPNGARVAIINGQLGSSTGMDRVQGIHEALKAGGDKYQIVAEQPANWDRGKALSVAQNILTSLAGNPPDVFLSVNDDMSLGVLEAIRGMGLSDRVKLVSYDAYPEGLKAVKAGQMVGDVEQHPSEQIRTALGEIVGKIRNGTELHTVIIKPTLITAKNIEQAERYSEIK
ncbi:MAG: substrate-binding domain-containing protein, partial [Acetobacteraceae bacterium]|nr:substrate-binding domain-containing protein [Acetobacteraceae bacterium]